MALLAIAPAGWAGTTPLSAVAAPRASELAAVPDLSSTAVAAATASLGSGHGPAAAHPWACQGLRMFGSPACGAVPRPLGSSVTGWGDAGPNPPPQSVNDFYLVDDASDDFVLLFGTTSTDLSDAAAVDLWAYAGGNWTALPATSPSPAPCPGSEIAYDSTDGYVLYLGGSSFAYGVQCPSSNQTWTYHAGAWTQQHPTSTPAGLVYASMSDDPADGSVILFGGETATACPPAGYCGATWAYAAGNWTSLSPVASPSARAEAGLAYDVHDGYVVLFGGLNQVGALNDTWTFASGNWTQRHPATSPPVPQPDAFSYDSADQVVVYTTAQNYSGNTPEITWTYAAGNWTHITSTPAPVERQDGQMADDPTDGIPVFFGGLGGGNGYQSVADSWTLHAGSWTNVTAPAPAPRYQAAVAYDPNTASVVVFGGWTYSSATSILNDTWSYANDSWTQLAPSRSPNVGGDPGMCWDAADGYMLLVGTSVANRSTVTWEYAGGTWTEVTPTSEPPAPTGEGVVYDAGDGYVLLLSGDLGSLVTWTYHAGVWTNRTGTAGAAPPGMTPNPLVYDPADAEVVFFGAFVSLGAGVSPGVAPLTYTFAGGRWHNASVANASAPPGMYDAAAAEDATDNGVLYWGGTNGIVGLGINATWRFVGGNWSVVGSPTHPTPRVGMRGAYDPTRGVSVFFGGDPLSYNTPCASDLPGCGDTWLWGSYSSSFPVIESFTVTPAQIDLGQAVNVTVRAGGGTGPLTYHYQGYPAGCTGANVSSYSCTPTSLGPFTFQLRVVDAAGQTASAWATLLVRSDPFVTSFVAAPPTVALGQTTTLETNATAGTGTYSYVYLNLPPGCATQDVPALPCAPSAAGNYTITVGVSDGFSGGAVANTTLTVSAAGGHGAPLVTSFTADPTALILGNATNVSVQASGAGPLAFSYSGLPAGCVTVNASAFRCTPTAAGTYPLRATVRDVHGNSTSVGTNLTVYPAGGGAGLSVSAFGANPGTVAVNATTFVQVVASGGQGSLSYRYSGLPPGCASANVALLLCTPQSAGSFAIHAIITDGAGHSAGVVTPLSVVGGITIAPEVSAFVASPSPAHVNASVTFFVAASGGTLPLAYAFGGLPSGCQSTDSPILTCTPAAAGNFSVTVNVTDAAGRGTRATTVVEVLPAPGPGTRPGGAGPSAGAPGWEAALLDGAVALAGAAVVVATALTWERRRRRREGEQLVAALDEDNANDTGPSP